MREDVLEKLQNGFPRGFLFVYVCPCGDVKVWLENPEKFVLLGDYMKLLELHSQKTERPTDVDDPGNLGGSF